MAGDRSLDEGPRSGADRPTHRGPNRRTAPHNRADGGATRGADSPTTQGPLLPGCQVRTSRADQEDEDRNDRETLWHTLSFRAEDCLPGISGKSHAIGRRAARQTHRLARNA
jgi:hypothetical protein